METTEREKKSCFSCCQFLIVNFLKHTKTREDSCVLRCLRPQKHVHRGNNYEKKKKRHGYICCVDDQR